jgi:hypothetical protein
MPISNSDRIEESQRPTQILRCARNDRKAPPQNFKELTFNFVRVSSVFNPWLNSFRAVGD